MLSIIASLHQDWMFSVGGTPENSQSYVVVDAPVAKRLLSYRQCNPLAKEAGGMLLGFMRGSHLHVAEATFPMNGDMRKLNEYRRLDSRHVQLLEAFHERTQGAGNYLGEWHTHPEAMPTPSLLDRKEWKKICQQRSALQLPSLFLIIGKTHVWVSSWV